MKLDSKNGSRMGFEMRIDVGVGIRIVEKSEEYDLNEEQGRS